MKTQCPSNPIAELRPGVSSFHQTTTRIPACTSTALRRQPSPIRKEALLATLAAHLLFTFSPNGMASPYVQLNGAQSRPFYVVAHNPNALDEPEKALINGCNALEPDITEITCNGQEVLIDFDSDAGVSDCGQTRLVDWCDKVNGLAQKYPRLALVILDIKDWAAKGMIGLGSGDPLQVQSNAAQILDAARSRLNANGMNLNIIYSIGSKDHFAIFDEILKKGPLSSRECLSIDGEDDPADVVQFFFDKGYSGAIGFGDGTAGPGPHLPRIMDRAAYLRASAGYPTMIPDVFLISEPTSMNFFIDAGVDGMIVTDGSQQQAVDIVKNVHDEVHLATREENPFQPLNEAYAVQVHTDSGINTGTDALLQFTLNGCRGSSTILYWTGDIHQFYDTARMRSGNDDWITIPSKDLGELQSIVIKNLGPDCLGCGAGWDMTEVHVSSARYIGQNYILNGQLVLAYEYSAVFGQTIKVGDEVPLTLTPSFTLPKPTVQCPAPIVTSNDPNQCGAIVNFSPGVSGPCDDVTAVCDPPSGSLFPVGTTVVTCYAKNASDQSDPCTFTVTVKDVQAPVITCPAPMAIDATSPAGATVSFAPTVSDNCPGTTVDCTPPSGSVFPVGDTSVNCAATDASNNQSSCDFNIHVKGAAEQTADLVAAVNNLNITKDGIKNALLAKLTGALAKIQSNNKAAACGELQAFIDQVTAQEGKGISASDAVDLIEAATQIRAVLGCN